MRKAAMDKTISAPDLSELCGIALYGDAVNKPVGIRDKQTFLLGVRTNLKSYNPTAPDAVLPALACGPEAQNSICIVEINETGDAYRIVWGLENGGRPLRQVII